MRAKRWKNVGIKRFSGLDEVEDKATECHKKAVWGKSYVTIPLLFPTKERLGKDAGIPADPYAFGCEFKNSSGNDSGESRKKMKRERECADVLRFAYSLSALQGLILHLKK